MDAPRRTAEKQPLVGVWLIVVCVFVYAMILVGGATRLTDSGLSITEWDLGKGLTPPLTGARWAEEFALYQRTVEYQRQNHGMSLAEFQYIYWWEWAHRFLGKLIGVVFALPFLFFALTRRLSGRFAPTLVLFAMGALQGFIGWWMVTSGLFSGLDVSPLRLAIHLGLAFLIIGFALWLALDCFGWPRADAQLGAPRWLPVVLLVALFAQIVLGAFLAGARNGAAVPEWPTIAGAWIPQDAFSDLLANPLSQHFLHRTTGYVVAGLALAVAGFAFRRGAGQGRSLGLALGGLAVAQAALGVSLIFTGAPLASSLVHQAGAAALWLCAIAALRASGRNILPYT